MSKAVSEGISRNSISLGDTHPSNIPDFDRFVYDASTGSYTVYLGINNPTLGTENFIFNKNTINLASSTPFYSNNSNFTSYTARKVRDPGLGDIFSELYLYKSGADNSQIQLTYVGFGVQIDSAFLYMNVPYSSSGRETLFIYGVPTAPSGVPLTGTAIYNGVVWGFAQTPASGSFVPGIYDISGIGTLTADFASSTIATSMTFSGTRINNLGGSTLHLGVPSTTVSGTGFIGSPGYRNNISTGGDTGALHGTFSGGASGSGTFSGRFYGPSAQEFGYNFLVTSGNITAGGIMVGKQ